MKRTAEDRIESALRGRFSNLEALRTALGLVAAGQETAEGKRVIMDAAHCVYDVAVQDCEVLSHLFADRSPLTGVSGRELYGRIGRYLYTRFWLLELVGKPGSDKAC